MTLEITTPQKTAKKNWLSKKKDSQQWDYHPISMDEQYLQNCSLLQSNMALGILYAWGC